MNFLLISPRRPRIIAQSSNPTVDTQALFPVGLAYVSAAMKAAGYEVVTANGNFLGDDIATALHRLIETNCVDVVCTGGQSIDVHGIKEIIDVTRQVNKSIKVVVGGAIVSADAETAMKVLAADVGVVGEGEEVMCELAAALVNDSDYRNIAGVVTWQDGRLCRAASRPEIRNLDALPLMDFEGFGYRKWLAENGNIGIIFTARSCPFKCTFCFKSTGNRYRARSLDNVFAEINYQIEHFGISTISVSDELFAAKRRRVVEFCDRIRPYQMTWSCSLRVPEIDVALLQQLKQAGCTSVGTGLESASDDVLKSMRKAVKRKQVEKALDAFAEADITMLGNLIFGDVGETVSTYRETLDFWQRYIDKLYINLGTVCTFPGTWIYQYACDNGLIADREKFLLEGQFVVNLSRMSDAEYWAMLSEITELSFLPQVPAAQVRILAADPTGHCEMEWQCRSCGQTHRTPDIHFLQAPIVTCSCGRPNTVEPFRDIVHDSAYLMSELPENEPLAFWGVGSQYWRLLRRFEVLGAEPHIQIDGSPHQQRFTRTGKKIHSPDAIETLGLRHVVITSPNAKRAIVEAIASDHPTVSDVYFPRLEAMSDGFRAKFERI
jgi:radical SAM superfamily enzyme YgiQ (UPF0313 family)